jgi:hypothetical protein
MSPSKLPEMLYFSLIFPLFGEEGDVSPQAQQKVLTPGCCAANTTRAKHSD